ncbi:MAG: biopolymer transporter ExbD [bacterium]|nr:biopolymer transporter ExbD [bacterium]
MRIDTNETEDELAMNLAPMIDVVFLLLIFFMVATTFVQREKEMAVELPVAESGDEAPVDMDEIVINLLSDGSIKVNGELLDQEQLDSLLVRAARSNPETPVTIRGDKDVVLQQAVSVMDSCRVAGLIDIGMMTLDG